MTGRDAAPVGFVGLGNMGWPMAHNLSAAGFSLIVHDADPARGGRFAAEHGSEVAMTAGDFGKAGVVVTMLPDDRAVADAVLRWEGGDRDGARTGSRARRHELVEPGRDARAGSRALGPRARH